MIAYQMKNVWLMQMIGSFASYIIPTQDKKSGKTPYISIFHPTDCKHYLNMLLERSAKLKIK